MYDLHRRKRFKREFSKSHFIITKNETRTADGENNRIVDPPSLCPHIIIIIIVASSAPNQ